MNNSELQSKTLLLLLAVVTIAFFWILTPFSGAIFWGAVLAIMFSPLHRWVQRKLRNRPVLAAVTTLGICLVLVILPLILIAINLTSEITILYEKLKSGEIDVRAVLQQVFDALPGWTHAVLDRLGMDSISTLQAKLSDAAVQGSRLIATNVLNFSLTAFDFIISFFVMLYLLFFLLMDGPALASRIQRSIPLSTTHKKHLFEKFATVIRATVKGNFLVAAAQGAMGGLAFWGLGVQGPMLWAVVMAFLSLLPAVGAAIIWAPVALFFLISGAIWKAVFLTAFGVLAIGMVDNVLRPILVGKDIKMPDYLVLISTIGGMSIFGLNGFVIGPVVAALFIALWDLFYTEQHRVDNV